MGFALQSDATAATNDKFATAEAFTDEVVGEAFQVERHARGIECAEGLAGNTFQIEGEG